MTRNKTTGSYPTGRSLANNSFFLLIIKFPAEIKRILTLQLTIAFSSLFEIIPQYSYF